MCFNVYYTTLKYVENTWDDFNDCNYFWLRIWRGVDGRLMLLGPLTIHDTRGAVKGYVSVYA